jgi:hypothetical protein
LRSCGGSSLAFAHPGSRALRRYSADQLGWAVRRVSRHVPRATCLVPAFLYILLRREGLQSRVQIGVTQDAGRFEAHAWVESQDRVILLNLETGMYHNLDSVGTRFLELLQSIHRLDAVHHALLEEFDVPTALLESDLLKLSQEMLARGLLVMSE